ncbi:hypothetical protein BFAG_00580 [Bacteroides fragilis 3_1_12]|uniref:Uncharacterized protein n=1 Tax=Bacteroides fragilis 3_1_12 TaxID=457424 RepID=A0ABN0BG30_BACFG|nr:hypothetical protein BFAG_00580 [Bacteroides fragilis 3_1_12]
MFFMFDLNSSLLKSTIISNCKLSKNDFLFMRSVHSIPPAGWNAHYRRSLHKDREVGNFHK